MSDPEREHEVGAFSFELSKVADPTIVDRMVANLANVDADLAGQVAAALGVDTPSGQPSGSTEASPALSIVTDATGPIVGRVVGVLVQPGSDVAGVLALRTALEKAGAAMHVIAPRGGPVKGAGRSTVPADATVFNADSVVYDALVVAGGVGALDPKSQLMLEEAYRHHKTLGGWGTGVDQLAQAGFDGDDLGIVVADKSTKPFHGALVDAIGRHRHWDR